MANIPKDEEGKKQGWGGFGGLKNIGQLGQSFRIQAEEKAKEAAKKVGLEEVISKKDDDSVPSRKPSTEMNSDAEDKNDSPKISESSSSAKNTETSSGQAASTGATPLSNRDADKVSKEELLDVLQKMNKRVKALSALRASLMDRVKAAESDKSRLMTILKSEVLTEADLEEAAQKAASKNAETAKKAAKGDENGEQSIPDKKIDEISMIQYAWRVADERNQLSLQQIQNEYKVISMQCQAEVQRVKEAAEAEKNAEIERVKAEAEQKINSKLNSTSDDMNGTEGANLDDQKDDDPKQKTIEEIKLKHEEELITLKSEMEDKFRNDMQLFKDKAEDDKAVLVKKLKEQAVKELELAKSEAKQEVEKAQRQAGELVSKVEAEKSILIEEEYKSKLDSRDAEILKLREEASNFSSQLAEIEKAHRDNISGIEEVYKRELEKTSNDANISTANAIDAIEQKHLSQIEKMKIIHEEKVQSLSKEADDRLATAFVEKDKDHSAKLQQILEEYENRSKEEMDEIKHNHIKERELEIERMRQDLIAQQRSDASRIREEERASLQIEIENLRRDFQSKHDTELEKMKNENQLLLSQINNLKSSHSSEIERLREEAIAEVKRSVEKSNKSQEANLRDMYEKQISEVKSENKFALEDMQKKCDEDLGKLRDEIASTTNELDVAKSELSLAQSEIGSLKLSISRAEGMKQEISGATFSEIEKIRKEATEEKNTMKLEHNVQLEELQNSLIASHKAELAQVKKDAEMELEQQRKNLTCSLQLEIENVKKAADMELQSEILKIREESATHSDTLKEELANTYAEKETALKKEIENRLNEKSAVMEIEAQTVANKSKADYEGKLEKMRSDLNATSDELERTKRKSDILEKELRQAKVDAARAVEDAESSVTAAKNELESTKRKSDILEKELSEAKVNVAAAVEDAKSNVSGKDLEAALSEQKRSFEETMKLQKDQSAESLKILQEKYEKHVCLSNQVQNEKDKLLSDIEMLRNDLKQAGDVHKHEVEALRSRNEEFQKSYSCITVEFNNLKEINDTLAKEINKIREEKEKSVQNHEQKLQDIDAKHKEAVKMQLKDKEQLNTEVIKLKQELEVNINASTEELETLRNSLKTANERIEIIQSEYTAKERILLEQSESASKTASENTEKMMKEKILKEKEMEKLLASYDEKLKASDAKVNKAIALAKKVKESAATKIKEGEEAIALIVKKHEQEIEMIQTEKEALQSTIETSFESKIQSLNEKHESVVSELKKGFEKSFQNEQLKVDVKLREIEEERKTISTEIEKNVTAKISEMNSEHSRDIENIKQEKRKLIEEKEREIENRLKVQREDFEREKQQMNLELDEKLKAAANKNESAKVALEQKMAKHADDLKTYFEEKLKNANNEFESCVANLESEAEKNKSKISQQKELIASLKEDKETLQNELKSLISNEVSLRKEIDILKNNLTETVENSSATASSLLEQQDKIEKDKVMLENEIMKLKRDVDLKQHTLEELNGKLEALTGNLNSLAADKKDLEMKLLLSGKQVAKLSTTETELRFIREELNRVKLEQTQSSSLVSRLQSEKDASERKHGQRTALIGMLEAQLSELNENSADTQAKLEAALYDLDQKDDELKNTKDQLEKAEKTLLQLQNNRRTANDLASQIAEKDAMKKAKLADALQKEVQSLQQQMARKSSAAQRLLQEREIECKELRKRTKLLQQELDKGTLSDRRIFELAAQQSNRESVAVAEIEIRDKLVQRLTEKLASRDGDLASAEYMSEQIEMQVEELCRVRRREDVNIDYLKSIVVQFLSKPPGSSERSVLLPVLATLLQFDENDYKMIEEGKSKVSWFGSVLPTQITAPFDTEEELNDMDLADNQSDPLLSSSSAEVVVSGIATPSSSVRSTRTSLQF